MIGFLVLEYWNAIIVLNSPVELLDAVSAISIKRDPVYVATGGGNFSAFSNSPSSCEETGPENK